MATQEEQNIRTEQIMSDEDMENYYPVLTNVGTCNIYYPTGGHIHVTTYTA